MMNGEGKSDRPIVPGKPPNKDGRGGQRGYGGPYTGTKVETPETAKGTPTATRARRSPTAEGVEGRGLAKGNPRQQNTPRTQSRPGVPSALERVRQAARRDRKMRFTALMHHIYDPDRLRQAYFGLKRQAAPGVDRVTWQQYGEALEDNLRDLSERLRRGAYRAKPVRRVFIAKADGRQRPLGVTALEDKIVQRATVEVLNAIYETDFVGFSYGFRPGRSQHDALDALSVGLMTKRVNWVLDMDIRGFLEASLHYTLAVERVLEEPRQGVRDPDSQAFAASAGDVDGFELAALYTLQHRLAGDAQHAHGIDHGHVALRRLLGKALTQPGGHADSPRRTGRDLLGRDEAVVDTAKERALRYAEDRSGLSYAEELTVRRLGRWLEARESPVGAQAVDPTLRKA